MSKLNITEEEVTVLYSEAGREMNYCDQKFTYDKEITVTQQCKNRINSVLTDMEVNFQPAEFQVYQMMDYISNIMTTGHDNRMMAEDD